MNKPDHIHIFHAYIDDEGGREICVEASITPGCRATRSKPAEDAFIEIRRAYYDDDQTDVPQAIESSWYSSGVFEDILQQVIQAASEYSAEYDGC